MPSSPISRSQCVVFSVWLLLASLPCVFLSAWHYAPLADPNSGLSILASEKDRPHAWHFITHDCPCSSKIFEQLRARKPHPDYYEHIVWLGDSTSVDRDALETSGWDLITGTAGEQIAQRIGLTGAPWFLVQDVEHNMLYSGGYMRQQPQSFIPSNDYRILTQLHDNQKVESLPAFGCAVGQDIRNLYDPLAIKYEGED